MGSENTTGDSSRLSVVGWAIAVLAAIAMIGLPLVLRDCALGKDLLANFLPAAAVGWPLAWWVGKQLNLEERKSQRRKERIARLEKALRYLELLEIECLDLQIQLPRIDKRLRQGEWSYISTSLWDGIRRGGELPILLDPSLLYRLIIFHDYVDQVRAAKHQLAQSRNEADASEPRDTEEKHDEYMAATLKALKDAMDWAEKELLPRLESEMETLRKQLDSLGVHRGPDDVHP